jgi:hypothetical protein
MNEFQKMLADLLKPKTVLGSGVNDTVERLTNFSDTMNLTDTITVTTSAPSRLVGTARVGYSECA